MREDDNDDDDDDDDREEMEARKRHYLNIVERVKAAVDRGDLSEKEARKKLAEVREEMFDNDDDDDDREEMEARKRRYLNAERRIDAAVARGDMTRDEAKRKLIEIKTQLFDKD